MSKIYINTDGGARGNPGPAAIGVVFCDEQGNELHKYHETIGVATNNQAEYKAIIKALELVSKSKWHRSGNQNAEIICRLDSQLVVEQINGNYKVKNGDIKVFISRITELLSELARPITFIHIPREQNKMADKLVNRALDETGK